MRSASFDELGGFVMVSMLILVAAGLSGHSLLEEDPEWKGLPPGFTEGYLADLLSVLFPIAMLPFVALLAIRNYRYLQMIVARCELAGDELAWIKRCPEHEEMVEDRELMRLATNVRRVCRTYLANHSLFGKFLEGYRGVLCAYGKTAEEERSGVIGQLNEAAEVGLENYVVRNKREYIHKETDKATESLQREQGRENKEDNR